MVVADADVQLAAKELSVWFGNSAWAVEREHVDALSTLQDQSEFNVALRVVSAVEALVQTGRDRPKRVS